MKVVFADTGYWIALIHPGDDLHDKATQLTTEIMPAKIITTDLVLNELLNAFSRRGSQFRRSAVSLIDSLLNDSLIEVIPQTTQLFRDGLVLYDQRPDQSWSHTDCVSFCMMQERSILEALAYDYHFEQAGFVAFLRHP